MTKIKDLPPYIKELKMYGNYYVKVKYIIDMV